MENQVQENQGVDKEVPNEERNKGAWNGHLDSEKSLPTEDPLTDNQDNQNTELNPNQPNTTNTTDNHTRNK